MFGDIADGKMQVNEYGQVVNNFWDLISGHFRDVTLDKFVIMPNHIHGIVAIFYDNCRGEVSSPISRMDGLIRKGGETPPLQKHTLGRITAYLKYQSAKQINQIRNTPGFPVWQRNYYEHIIRNEGEMNRIREYIINNPAKWIEDENNPANIKS
ncbi:MAG: transposase [Nitrospirota bacterium]